MATKLVWICLYWVQKFITIDDYDEIHDDITIDDYDEIHDDITIDDYDEIHPVFLNKTSSVKLQEKFEKTEKTGTDVFYRCLRCRNCSDCKNNDKIVHISIQEEVEQNLINKSITVNLEKCETIAKLPFIKNPIHRLSTRTLQ